MKLEEEGAEAIARGLPSLKHLIIRMGIYMQRIATLTIKQPSPLLDT